ncbi:hypothetical protein NDI45_03000 [Leptolyngbya sp. GB1-A1]|uniref:Ig-like domain-containing protein n=1 Tax=Leptolyngbya sp. GB1-A1 TaxID=2933908 RepID=UPI00329948FC
MANSLSRLKSLRQPIDRTAIVLILALTLAIGGLIIKGDRAMARVRDFSWAGRQVGAEDTAFILTFSRPMDHSSVESNLKIDPPLSGKVSWAGRRMAYTLETPAPYGETYQVTLSGIRDRFTPAHDPHAGNSQFSGTFRTRERAFVYLGVAGEEKGRLVLQNLTRQEKRILTPPNLAVMEFEPYPQGDRILFSATDSAQNMQNVLDQQLYTVSTGIQIESPASTPTELKQGVAPVAVPAKPAGTINLILDNKDYQNLKFDLSPDGESIVVQRANRKNQAEFGLWMLKTGAAPQQIKTEPGGDFLIAPDSRSLAMSQGQGMAILPLATDAQRLDFLPRFGMILSFSQDGSAAAMVNFNSTPGNPSRSLFYVTNQGTEKELLKTNGSILKAQFDRAKQTLYCLYTKLLPGDLYLEEPYIAAIHLETGKLTDLLRLPLQRDIQVSLAPDGLGILFDQIVATNDPNQSGSVQTQAGTTIASSQLWFLPVVQDDRGNPVQAQPQALNIAGLRPRWLP